MNICLQSIRKNINAYRKDRFPKKKTGDKTYYYLKYRDGKKVVSEYVSKSRIDEMRAQLEKRKHIEAMMKALLEELAIANKVLEEAL